MIRQKNKFEFFIVFVLSIILLESAIFVDMFCFIKHLQCYFIVYLSFLSYFCMRDKINKIMAKRLVILFLCRYIVGEQSCTIESCCNGELCSFQMITITPK